jgi:hypothetical protein
VFVITDCTHGATPRRGINYVRVSDGGIAVVVWVGRYQFFYRRRGKMNPGPRHVMNLNVLARPARLTAS